MRHPIVVTVSAAYHPDVPDGGKIACTGTHYAVTGLGDLHVIDGEYLAGRYRHGEWTSVTGYAGCSRPATGCN